MISVEEFIEKLAASDDKILVSEANSIQVIKGLKKSKEGLDEFLKHAIVEIYFLNKEGKVGRVIACSNTPLIKAFSLKKSTNYEKQLDKLSKMKSEGIVSKSPNFILSWNFLKNDYCRIPMKHDKITDLSKLWRVSRWITITEENFKIINKVLRNILDKDKNSDKMEENNKIKNKRL